MVDLEFENIWKQYQAEREASHAAPSQTADPQAGQADGTEPAAEGTFAEAASDATPAQPGEAAGEAGRAAGDTAQSAALASERPPTADEDDEARRADYRRIAERRVRLGLLLAEVGRNNNITVLQDELNQAIAREARRHPGYEREVLEFYRQDPDAVATLRAPIFEDKVIDFITELAKIEDRKVTPQELMSAADDAEETHAAPGTAGDT
ncbi:MAG: hypothetical protein J2P48_21110 [Alphaproteobacteria bacterium]|nr:hypothetical protein [Alphaproteobacteria bacterium]